MKPEVQVCTNSLTCGTAAQPLTYNVNYDCNKCSNVSNCDKCFFRSSTKAGDNDT